MSLETSFLTSKTTEEVPWYNFAQNNNSLLWTHFLNYITTACICGGLLPTEKSKSERLYINKYKISEVGEINKNKLS